MQTHFDSVMDNGARMQFRKAEKTVLQGVFKLQLLIEKLTTCHGFE